MADSPFTHLKCLGDVANTFPIGTRIRGAAGLGTVVDAAISRQYSAQYDYYGGAFRHSKFNLLRDNYIYVCIDWDDGMKNGSNMLSQIKEIISLPLAAVGQTEFNND